MTRAQGTYERTSRKTDWSRTGRDPHGFRTCTNARKRTTTVRVLNYDTLSWNSSLLMYLQELWTCSKLSVEWMNFISLPINWTYLKNKKRTKNKCKRRHAFRKCCHLFDEHCRWDVTKPYQPPTLMKRGKIIHVRLLNHFLSRFMLISSIRVHLSILFWKCLKNCRGTDICTWH